MFVYQIARSVEIQKYQTFKNLSSPTAKIHYCKKWSPRFFLMRYCSQKKRKSLVCAPVVDTYLFTINHTVCGIYGCPQLISQDTISAQGRVHGFRILDTNLHDKQFFLVILNIFGWTSCQSMISSTVIFLFEVAEGESIWQEAEDQPCSFLVSYCSALLVLS